MSFFRNYPEFVELDTRRHRGFSPVTFETLDNRHQVALPEWLVRDNSVLDLGSCLAATGNWVLAHGASSYTGVEAQADLVDISRRLLEGYWPGRSWSIHKEDIRAFLRRARVQAQRWDVVVLIGVVYAFLDTYGLLEDVAEITDYAVIVDSIYPWNMTTAEVSIIDVIRAQHINSSDGATAYQGAGARPSPQALSIMMETLGFENREGLLYPEPITVEGQHDSYLQPIERPGSRSAAVPARYLARFYRTDASTLRPVTDSVVGAVKANQVPMARAPVIKNSGSWSFDAGVAQRFQREAECHIPDYQRVLDLSAEIVDRVYPGERGLGIVDVGSALGHTLKLFTDRGYVDVWGLESSPAMRDSSQLQDRVRLCSEFPKDRAWRVVLANWTLHFVQEREQYLQAVYDQLEPGGCLIISDKMSHGSLEEELYHEFKRGNGISEEEIAEKKARLVGVLTPRPLEWYLETLKRIGFTDLAVVNSRYMFHTIYARRY